MISWKNINLELQIMNLKDNKFTIVFTGIF